MNNSRNIFNFSKINLLHFTRSSSRKVVVTGIGLVTPLGCGSNYVWKKLLAGCCGVQNLIFKDCELPCTVAAIVPKGDKDHEFHGKPSRSVSLASNFALLAADEALKDSNWLPSNSRDQKRTGVAIGTGLPDLQLISETINLLDDQNLRRVSPFFIPSILNNMSNGHISIKYKLKGPSHSVSTACTTGAHAIGDACRFISHGDCDVMVAGGTEANLNKYGLAGFCRAKALSTKFNDDAKSASRPFHPQRDGFVMGEGAGVIVLEEEQHALRRNAKVYARIHGYGLSTDANHITAPCPDGAGAFACMQSALQDANFSTDDVTYINAHATSTPLGDAAETQAIGALFGEAREDLAVSSTKGAIGHLLGAAGAVEAIFTILACYHGYLPPTLNLDKCDDELIPFNFVPNTTQQWKSKKRIALSNSFGFGGTNASLCISN